MIHHRQRLTLDLEPHDDLFGVHAQLDDLAGNTSSHRLCLLGDIHNATATLNDFSSESCNLTSSALRVSTVANFAKASFTASNWSWGAGVEICPNHPRPQVKLLLPAQRQADYLGVPAEGMYKPEHNRR